MKMKHLPLFAALIGLAACSDNTPSKITPVASVTLDKPDMTLAVGETGTLIATVLPANAEDKNVTWASSDEDIASVPPSGIGTPSGSATVTAVSPGVATVTVKTNNGGLTDNCTVTVLPFLVVGVLDVGSPTSATMRPDSLGRLDAGALVSEAAGNTIIWDSGDPTVVEVSQDGVLKSLRPGGPVTITAIAAGGGLRATCLVTVAKD